jgi:hypothetical protein
MSTDKQAVEASAADERADHASDEAAEVEATPSDAPPEGPADGGTAPGDGPSWWHRDHPTFAALSGFFTGLLFVALVPALYVGALSLIVGNDRVEELFPFVLVTLVVPLGLSINKRTRRFGTYFWIGMVLTTVVVIGVGALVLWYLVEHQS